MAYQTNDDGGGSCKYAWEIGQRKNANSIATLLLKGIPVSMGISFPIFCKYDQAKISLQYAFFSRLATHTSYSIFSDHPITDIWQWHIK